MSNQLRRDAIKRWVAALNSGEYKENRSIRLRDNTGFSAYGVLLQVLIDGGYNLKVEELHHEGVFSYGNKCCQSFIPEEVINLLKFSVDETNQIYAAIVIWKKMADFSFEEMAEFIWKNRKLLFGCF